MSREIKAHRGSFITKTLSALVITCALAAVQTAPAAAQTATKLDCKDCIKSKQIENGKIKGKDLKDKTVSNDKIEDGAVDGSKIEDGAVKTEDLADGAVTGAKIVDGTIELADLSAAAQQTNAGLQAQVNALEALVVALGARLTAAESALATAQTSIGMLQGDPIFELSTFVTVDEVPTDLNNNGNTTDTDIDLDGDGVPDAPDELLPRVLFEGVNVQVVNGEGATNSLNALGNLIVGYNEKRSGNFLVCSDGQFDNESDCTSNGHVWAIGHKSGSHNLVVGRLNSYSQYAGVVFGTQNVINRDGATVTGGRFNASSGVQSSVSGGITNKANEVGSSVSGGQDNVAGGISSSVNGGKNNVAGGLGASVSGGNDQNIVGDCNWGGERVAGIFGDDDCNTVP